MKRKKNYGKIERAIVEIGCVKCHTAHKIRFKGYRGQSRRSMLSRCWTTIKASYEAMGWRKLEEGWVCNRCTGIRGWLFKKVFAEDTKKIDRRRSMERLVQIRELLKEVLDHSIKDAIADAEDGCKPEQVVVHLTYDEAKLLEKLLV